MAQYLTVSSSGITQGVGFNCDRLATVNPTATIIIYDSNGNPIKTILGNAPEISIREG